MRQKMKVLGITGGVGAGKSTILSCLETRYGARVIQADAVGRLLQQPGTPCYDRITRTFGQEILMSSGRLDRARLAEVVFGDPEKLSQLNAIMHPAVKRYIRDEICRERAEAEAPFVVVEAALLLEDHYEELCDEIWYVYTEAGVRAQRLQSSRGYTREKTEQIMANQLPESEYRRCCQFVIDNSSNFVENTYEQIEKGLIEHGFL